MAAPIKADWEAVEIDWRAGVKTKNQMARDHGVSRTAIDKHFTKMGLSRDLAVKIRERADALVAQQKVATRLQVTENVIIEANAQVQVKARNKHQELAERKIAVNEKLLVMLEEMVESSEEFKNLGEILATTDDKGLEKLNDVYRKVIALPGHIDNFKKLTETHKILVALHRQSVGLSDNSNGEADKPPTAQPTDLNDVANRMMFVLNKYTKGK